ncbi:MAG TPA: glycosyltransferase family 1 protein [Anaerolineae bacterium]|nr:glycosyltransferase family 1 protein [Anaerolineae bacterium]HQJ51331.1 glycosyltransferase family 1 protein [Anaerolineae bacterium]
MRIGIDYTAAVNQGAGIGRYARQMTRALLELDRENEYVLFVPSASPEASRASESAIVGQANVSLARLPLSERALVALWHRLRVPVPVELFSGRLDVFHSPDFALAPVLRARTLVTVHDLSFRRVPECFKPALLSYLNRVVPRSVARADIVLADSESTRNDAIELLRLAPERVFVVYAGVDSRFHRVTDQGLLEDVRSRYSLPGRFVLSVGTLQPRKNYVRLIEAFSRLSGVEDVSLVISGARGWLYEEIYRRVEELGLSSRVLFPGYVAEADLPALYSLSEVFAFPSLYEGFGLPPLEAMACGTPVVVSRASSLPEVVGNAGCLVDPLSVEEIAGTLQALLDSPARRADLAEQGVAQAARFTWSEAARVLLGLYRG